MRGAVERYGYEVRMSPEKARYYVRRQRQRPAFVRFVDPDRIVGTMRAGYMKSRGAEALVREGKGGMRMLTIDECKAIQSFPRSYRFAGPVGAVYAQIGNAVPPTLAFHVLSG